MKILTKIHDRVAPPGLEVRLLKAMPAAALAAIIMPLVLALGARALSEHLAFENAAKAIKSIDIFAWSLSATLLTAVVTIAIGCVVVWIMKGPAYVADAYPVSHSNRPVDSDNASSD